MAYGARAGVARGRYKPRPYTAESARRTAGKAVWGPAGSNMLLALADNLDAADNPHGLMKVDQPRPNVIRVEWPTQVISINDLLKPRYADIGEQYRRSMRTAARTAGIHAFETLGFKHELFHSANNHYTYLMDRLHIVHCARVYDAEKSPKPDSGYDDGNIGACFKSGSDGAYDAIVGFSISKANNMTWLGHYADAKVEGMSSVRATNPIYRYGQHHDSSGQVPRNRRAMRVIYEFSEDVVAQ